MAELNTDDFVYCLTPQEAAENVEKRGFTAFWPDEETITLDLDGKDDEEAFERLFPIAADIFGFYVVDEWRSKDDGRHVVVNAGRKLTATDRIAFQACLGSDRKRELLGLHLLNNRGVGQPTVLFKPGEEHGRKT